MTIIKSILSSSIAYIIFVSILLGLVIQFLLTSYVQPALLAGRALPDSIQIAEGFWGLFSIAAIVLQLLYAMGGIVLWQMNPHRNPSARTLLVIDLLVIVFSVLAAYVVALRSDSTTAIQTLFLLVFLIMVCVAHQMKEFAYNLCSIEQKRRASSNDYLPTSLILIFSGALGIFFVHPRVMQALRNHDREPISPNLGMPIRRRADGSFGG